MPGFTVTRVEMHHSAQVVLVQRKQNGSAPVPKTSGEYHYEFGVINFDFTSDSISTVTKSEE